MPPFLLVFGVFLIKLSGYRCGDVFSFDWSALGAPKQSYYEEFDSSGGHFDATELNRNDYTPIAHKNDLIESEFGVIQDTYHVTRRPKLLTYHLHQRRNDSQDGDDLTSYVQKIPKIGKNPVNSLLKSYLAKLYLEKYQQKKDKAPFVTSSTSFDDDASNQESKLLFDGGASFSQLKNKTKNFAQKFLSLFTVVQFPNSQCQTSGVSGSYLGTCFHQSECDNMNGTAIGACAQNYGVCCVFRSTCGATSGENCTYFESPGYPNYDPPGNMVLPPVTVPPAGIPTVGPTPDPRKYLLYTLRKPSFGRENGRQADSSLSCSIHIIKMADNIQQMRIDFVDLELSGPTNGTCTNERLVISGQNVNNQIPPICGYNSGQHVYVDVSMLTGPLQLSVLSNTGQRKRFNIRICQIAAESCTNTNNCLQYYTGATGSISSFNYDQAVVNRSVPGYFNNLNYAICIRKEAGYCSITYSNSPAGLEYPFQFRNLNDAGQSTVPPGQAGAEIFNCPDDYIVIGGIRLCGDKFNDGTIIENFRMNAPVTDTSAGPIIIPVRTNQAVTGRGFKLFYTQNLCSTTRD